MVRILGAVLCALLLLPVVSCGGPSDEDKATKALSKSLFKDSSDLKLSKKQVDCVAGKMVHNVGVKDLQKYGILTKKLTAKKDVQNVKMSKSDANGAADAMTDCVDGVKLMVDSMGENATATQKSCIQKALKEKDVHDFFAAIFNGDQEGATTTLTKPLMGCLSQS